MSPVVRHWIASPVRVDPRARVLVELKRQEGRCRPNLAMNARYRNMSSCSSTSVPGVEEVRLRRRRAAVLGRDVPVDRIVLMRTRVECRILRMRIVVETSPCFPTRVSQSSQQALGVLVTVTALEVRDPATACPSDSAATPAPRQPPAHHRAATPKAPSARPQRVRAEARPAEAEPVMSCEPPCLGVERASLD